MITRLLVIMLILFTYHTVLATDLSDNSLEKYIQTIEQQTPKPPKTLPNLHPPVATQHKTPSNHLLFSETTTATANQNTHAAQVLIKARIINIDHDSLNALGIIFNTQSKQSDNSGLIMDTPDGDNFNDLTLPIANLGQGILLNATLSALEKNGHAKTISDPELLTLNNKTATIEAGQDVPYQQSTYSGGTSTSFKKALLKLAVTPQIMSDNHILMHLTINQDRVSSLNINGVPAINTQKLTTQVLMRNKNTLVLGGILQQDESEQQQNVPGLSKIPLLGALFRHRQQAKHQQQLLIFMTPVIVQ